MKRTILLLDDDRHFRRLVATVLEERGYRVLEAATAAQGEELVAAEELDFALVDRVLPDGQGPAWLERVRARGEVLPVALVSAEWQAEEDLSTLGRELGVAWIAYKPLDPVLFASRLAEHFGERAAMDGAKENALSAKLAALRHEYGRRLPGKLAAVRTMLRRLADSSADAELRERTIMEVHRIRGTAGSYGLGPVGIAAGTIEDALEGWAGDGGTAPAGGWSALHAALAEAARHAASSAPEEARHTLGAPTGRILVVDDDREFVELSSAMARPHLLDVLAASTPAEALTLAHAQPIDAALVDVKLCTDSGFDLAHALRAVPGCADLPIAFISVIERMEERVAAVHAGALAYLTKPVEPSTFVDVLRQLVDSNRQERPRVLIVEDDPDSAAHTSSLLEATGVVTTIETDPSQTVAALERVQPDLLLLDLMMPNFDGRDVCRAVRMAPRWQTLPVVFLTVRADRETKVDAYRAGGDDYLIKPVLPEELVARVRVRLERARLLRDRSDRDALTGLANRRAFVEAAEARISEARRADSPLSICLLDLDRFKSVNDTYGHVLGDRVLLQIGRLLRQRFRPYDLRCRWGGEEFVLLFPGERVSTARELATRLLAEVRAVEFESDDGRRFTVTFTAGVAGVPSDGTSLQELLATADERLYAGKAAGRARVVSS